MTKNFLDIVAIARENVQHNPGFLGKNTKDAALKYLSGLIDEVKEVADEVKEDNEVHLVDELSDIAWDYATLLALLEERNYISSIDTVIEHAHTKYTERSPAFLQQSQGLWDEIKGKQKIELARRHKEKYGN